MPTKIEEPGISPPNHLDRREKREFRRVVEARNDLGRPLRVAEVDTVVDYLRVRERLDRLDMIASRFRGSPSSYPSEYMQTVRAIETATATSRRLAHDLGLIPNAD